MELADLSLDRAAIIAFGIESRSKRRFNRGEKLSRAIHWGSDFALASTLCGLGNANRDQ